MTPKKPAGARRVEAWPAIQGRMPRGCVDWLLDRAAETGTTMSEQLRACVLEAMSRAGDLNRYGLELETAEDDA